MRIRTTIPIFKTGSIEGALASLESQLQEQIDGKIETWRQTADPSSGWTDTEKIEHKGDLWYYTGSTTSLFTKNMTYRWDGAGWEEETISEDIFDEIDGKSTIYYGPPSGTYENVKVNDYLVDSTDGTTYKWNGTAWLEVTNYAEPISRLFDTWTQEENPALEWANDEKEAHDGDLWHYTGTEDVAAGATTIHPEGTYIYVVTPGVLGGLLQNKSGVQIVNKSDVPITVDSVYGEWQEYSMTEDNLYDYYMEGIEDASKTATNYMKFDENTGLTVGAEGLDSAVNIKYDGVRLVKGDDVLASFGESVELISQDTTMRGTRVAKLSGSGLFLSDGENDLAGFRFVDKSNGYPDGGCVDLGKNAKIYVQSETGHYPSGETPDEGAIDLSTSGGISVTVHTDRSVAFRNPSGTFVVVSHEISLPTTSANDNVTDTATFTKSGYFPVGVVGFNTNRGSAVPSRLYLSASNSGSATVSYSIRAVDGFSAATMTVNILWVRIE